jgi:hypothetical protein
MFPTYIRTNPTPLTEFGNLAAGFSPYQGTSITRLPRARLFEQSPRRYRQFPEMPIPLGPAKAVGYPEYQGQSLTRPPRSSPAFLRQVERRFRQTPPEWGMLGGTQPTLPAHLLPATAVRPRIAGREASHFRRANRPPDYMATVGPGLSARLPFVGSAVAPRLTARDFLMRARRYQQTDPRGALSGLTARTLGSFTGAKLGFLSIQPTRSSTNFTVTPHRAGSLTVQ